MDSLHDPVLHPGPVQAVRKSKKYKIEIGEKLETLLGT
jgi:hypothetical protein